MRFINEQVSYFLIDHDDDQKHFSELFKKEAYNTEEAARLDFSLSKHTGITKVTLQFALPELKENL